MQSSRWRVREKLARHRIIQGPRSCTSLYRLVNMADDFDAERSGILRSVAQIGPAKPIGYLPLYTIRDILKMEPHALAQDSAAKGLSAALFGPAQCCIKSGALYLFDRQSLELLLLETNSVSESLASRSRSVRGANRSRMDRPGAPDSSAY
jgi:hypothetical protein